MSEVIFVCQKCPQLRIAILQKSLVFKNGNLSFDNEKEDDILLIEELRRALKESSNLSQLVREVNLAEAHELAEDHARELRKRAPRAVKGAASSMDIAESRALLQARDAELKGVEKAGLEAAAGEGNVQLTEPVQLPKEGAGIGAGENQGASTVPQVVGDTPPGAKGILSSANK